MRKKGEKSILKPNLIKYVLHSDDLQIEFEFK